MSNHLESIPALELNGVQYAYRNNWTFRSTMTLKGLSLVVRPGEAFGFLGPNGAGKTTTIKCILGLTKIKAGSINIFGKNASDPLTRRTVGYLSEHPYFYDYLTVQEIMEMYATLGGVPSRELNSKIAVALEKVHLTNRAGDKMRTLSKGLTQRVAMAQAIVAEPQLLILDEPFSGLDPIGRREFKDLIFSLKKSGTTILMSSHILSDVEDICDRVSIMVKGELKGLFDLKDIPRSSGATYEVTLKGAEQLESQLKELATHLHQRGQLLRATFDEQESALRALRLIIESNATLESYQFVHGSLEDLFLELVKNGGSQ